MKENQIRSCFQPPFSRPPRLIPRLIPLLLTAAGLLFSPGPLPGPAADEPPAPSLTQPLPLSPEETAWVRGNPQVTVSLLSSWAPFEYLNDREEPAGYSVDYVKILCRKLGLTPRFLQDLSWQEYMDRFRRGGWTS